QVSQRAGRRHVRAMVSVTRSRKPRASTSRIPIARRWHMSARLAALAGAGALTLTMVCAGCDEGVTTTEAGTQAPLFTLSPGSQSTLLGRATFADPSDPPSRVTR